MFLKQRWFDNFVVGSFMFVRLRKITIFLISNSLTIYQDKTKKIMTMKVWTPILHYTSYFQLGYPDLIFV